jgi:hypothetical protein
MSSSSNKVKRKPDKDDIYEQYTYQEQEQHEKDEDENEDTNDPKCEQCYKKKAINSCEHCVDSKKTALCATCTMFCSICDGVRICPKCVLTGRMDLCLSNQMKLHYKPIDDDNESANILHSCLNYMKNLGSCTTNNNTNNTITTSSTTTTTTTSPVHSIPTDDDTVIE